MSNVCAKHYKAIAIVPKCWACTIEAMEAENTARAAENDGLSNDLRWHKAHRLQQATRITQLEQQLAELRESRDNYIKLYQAEQEWRLEAETKEALLQGEGDE